MPGEFLEKFKAPVLVLLGGVLFISLGILAFKSNDYFSSTKVEIIESSSSAQLSKNEITVEIAGEVFNPAVYKLPDGSRIDDLIINAGGLSEKADKTWIDKYLNRASKLADGQKVYIPKVGEQNNAVSAKNGGVDQSISGVVLGQNTNLVNINTATTSDLDKLPGIGPTYAQKIIEQRPYSNTEELVSKKVISKSLFEKIKNSITIY